MKLVTFRTPDRKTQAGVISDNTVITLDYPTLLELLQDPDGMTQARQTLERFNNPQGSTDSAAFASSLNAPFGFALHLPVRDSFQTFTLNELVLLAPILEPPTLRDFYAFEQHVAAARAKRGAGMIPEWYEIPTFYFSNTSEIYGPDQDVPYPVGSNELDIELEIACVIGREGKDISVEEAGNYIAGYTIMNDWSARDFQRKDMKLNLGPGKGKDFATSLGPWLVTPDELAARLVGNSDGPFVSPQSMSSEVRRGGIHDAHPEAAFVSPQSAAGEERNVATGRDESAPTVGVVGGGGGAAGERYDMTMVARVDGREISRGNFKDIYYSFPQMIAYASRNARLRPGDVIGSGTVGTGCLLEIGTEVHPWFQRGEVIELEIEGLGVLRNRIV